MLSIATIRSTARGSARDDCVALNPGAMYQHALPRAVTHVDPPAQSVVRDVPGDHVPVEPVIFVLPTVERLIVEAVQQHIQ